MRFGFLSFVFVKDDRSSRSLTFCLQANSRIKELDLSHNEFCERGGEYLGQLLGTHYKSLVFTIFSAATVLHLLYFSIIY